MERIDRVSLPGAGRGQSKSGSCVAQLVRNNQFRTPRTKSTRAATGAACSSICACGTGTSTPGSSGSRRSLWRFVRLVILKKEADFSLISISPWWSECDRRGEWCVQWLMFGMRLTCRNLAGGPDPVFRKEQACGTGYSRYQMNVRDRRTISQQDRKHGVLLPPCTNISKAEVTTLQSDANYRGEELLRCSFLFNSPRT
ncbi:hypothetical protein N656DRAFT_345229 [Canariomyces notabilis]|uniref:Uncharacterized protein n=1 Tax=Canariomyces notabilis TaxID=2074819 RepID=A0AAN6T8L4_9PEZI|nr:hypothetical protein N656DRAFT_345229 [Canariomyces arenarius]